MTRKSKLQAKSSESDTIANEQTYSAVLRSMNDAVLCTDAAGKIEFMNAGAEKLLSLKAADCVGKQLCDCMELKDELTGDQIEHNPKAVGKAGSNRQETFCAIIKRLDGKSVPVDATVSLIEIDGRKSGSAVWVLRNMDKRGQAEVLLRESESRFNLLADSTADVIILVDSAKKITFWNSAAARLSGFSADEVIGNELAKHVRFQARNEEVDHPNKANDQIGYYNYLESITQMEIVTKDGDYCPVEATFSSIQLKGDWHTVLICRDIRERKRAEREINKYRLQLEELVQERTRELMTANRQLKKEIAQRINEEEQRRRLEERVKQAEKMESLGILAGGVAHDLNNMLSPLLGYPQLLLAELPPDSKLVPMIGRIEAAAQDAVAIVEDLHTLSRRRRCELVPMILNSVVERFLQTPAFERLNKRKPNIKVNTNLHQELPQMNGSAPLLLKVIMNLVVNAYDAMPDTGEITIQTSVARLTKLVNGYENITPGNYIMLRVRDTGEGIPDDKLKRIFEPYFSTKQMNESGTGLGLSIVYGVVKDHNGYYDVISHVGRGTEFILYFPLAKSEKAESVDLSQKPGGIERILIVDDNKSQREVASDILTHLGYDTVTVSSGREAVDYVRDNDVDLVVIDMVMETDFDGLTTYQEITRLKPGLKALLVSGYPSSERVEQAQSLGAGPFVEKPLDLVKISKVIKEVLPE